MATPSFKGPDGKYRSQMTYSTTVPFQFLSGSVDASSVDVQVRFPGQLTFSSNPDFVTFSSGQFFIPNPAAMPNGLPLDPGPNLFEVRSVLSSGDTTAPAQVTILLVQDDALGDVLAAPTGISLERFDRTVRVSVESVPGAVGYNFYASSQAGGGRVGYNRINPLPVIGAVVSEESVPIATLPVDVDIVLGSDGTHVANPQFLVFSGQQQTGAREVLVQNFLERLEIPQTTDRVKVSVSIDGIRQVSKYEFEHDRLSNFQSAVNPSIPNADFVSVPISSPLYYVATALYLVDGTEIETEFSPEVSGAPLVVTPSVGLLPTVSRQQIVGDISKAIFRNQPELAAHPSSVIKDTFIDPFSTEAERMRFLVDFIHIAQSFTTLLAIDDPGGTGASVPVGQSSYKTAMKAAFFLNSDADVQAIIDSAFDKLASSRGVIRDNLRRSRGEVTFYMRDRPQSSVVLPIGTRVLGSGIAFRTTSIATISPSGAGASFSPLTGRWAANAYIQAESAGSAGNLAPTQIHSIPAGPSGVLVTNQSATFGGLPIESNIDLAQRADRALASVDTGTLQGVNDAVLAVPGVRQAAIIDAGHPLMARDVDAATARHVGGKVDAWIRGSAPALVSDNAVFPFTIEKAAQFEPVGDPGDLRFRMVDPVATAANPILEVLDFPSAGYRFMNRSTGKVYDLTGVSIEAPDVVVLAQIPANIAPAAITDTFSGSVRRQVGSQIILSRQPVRKVLSISAASTGIPLQASDWDLWRDASPFLLGRSSLSGDSVRFYQGLSAIPLSVTSEEHVMLGGAEPLGFLGVNPLSVHVFNQARSREYVGPYNSTGDSPEYTIILEKGTTPLQIVPVGTAIAEGLTVLVDYLHDENLVIRYEHDALVAITQERIDGMRHCTADVLAKQAIPVPVDISATIVIRSGIGPEKAEPSVRTALARLFNTLALGQPIRQGDVINTIEALPEVSYVVVPLTRLSKADEAQVTREDLQVSVESDILAIPAWSSSQASTWLLRMPLVSSTQDAGGTPLEYRGIHVDSQRMLHSEDAPGADGSPLRMTPGTAFIIGNEGLSIPGFSDDATLAAGQVRPADYASVRRSLTANRVLVSLLVSDSPLNHSWYASYLVSGDTRADNVEVGPIEYLALGVMSFVWDMDTLARQGARR